MRAKFYILDCQDNYQQVNLSANHGKSASLTLNPCNHNDFTSSQTSSALTTDVPPIDLHYLLKELELSECFRKRVICYLKNVDRVVILRVIPVSKGVIDYEWCNRATAMSWEKVEQEELMSWLSTLGGAFSALGDSFGKCAETAGKISMYQLRLAMKSGDPSIVLRCKLYYSISLIQKGELRKAKNVVKEQYALAKSDELCGDERLYKMCHGIWLKLQYAYHLRKQKRLAAVGHTVL